MYLICLKKLASELRGTNQEEETADYIMQQFEVMGYDLRTSPESDCFEWGTTGDWSDHVPFRLLGIPTAYFEWMNWDIEPCGGEETAEYGWILHT